MNKAFIKCVSLILISSFLIQCAIVTSTRQGNLISTSDQINKNKIIDYHYVILKIKNPSIDDPTLLLKVVKFPIYEAYRLQVYEKIVKKDPMLGGILIGTPVTFGIFYLLGLLFQKNDTQEQNSYSYYQDSTTKTMTPLEWGATGALLAVSVLVVNRNTIKSREEKAGTIEKIENTFPSSPDSLYIPAKRHSVEIEWQTSGEKKSESLRTDELGLLKVDLVDDLKITKINSPKGILDISVKVKNEKNLFVVKNEALELTSWLVPYSFHVSIENASLYNQPDNFGKKVIGIESGKELFIQEVKGEWIKAEIGERTGWLPKTHGEITYVEPEYYDAKTPPLLETTVKFDDSDSHLRNQMLDGNEEAKLVAIVSNRKGIGKAHQVRLILNSSNTQVILKNEILIGTINVGEEKTIEVPIKAPLKIADDLTSIRIETKEKNGNDAAPIKLSLPIKSIELPKLRIESCGINDGNSGLGRGNGNGIAENGETIELIVHIRNEGRGEAHEIKANLDVRNAGIELIKKEVNIPLINPMEKVSVPFAFIIPKTFKDNHIEEKIRFQEGRGAFDFEQDLPPLGVNILAPLLRYSYLIHDGDSPQSRGNKDGKIQQGEIIELIIVPENRGTLEADGVKANVESPVPSILSIGKIREDIGKILWQSKAEAISFIFNIQRKTVPGKYWIPITLSQNDFEAYKDKILLEVQAETEEVVKIGPNELTNKPPPVVKAFPIVIIGYPEDGHTTIDPNIMVFGRATAAKKVMDVKIKINGLPLKDKRGIAIVPKIEAQSSIPFNFPVPLEIGKNNIEITAIDNDNLVGTKQITVVRTSQNPEIWLVCIGINKYLNGKIQELKYAVDDAKAVAEYFINALNITPDHAFILLEKDAYLKNLKTVLGTELKKRAKLEDMVIIYFAGHGFREEDPNNPDGDGFEKYLLPFDVDPKDLFSTAFPIRELQTIFDRILAQKLVFLADSCFSGATNVGNIRTLSLLGFRTGDISDKFLDRISKGKGRVILTAAMSHEGSREIVDLKHGVFTYYLLRGLKGEADFDKDGLITIDEISQYVQDKVSKATEEEQHPVRKGDTAGVFVLGRTKK